METVLPPHPRVPKQDREPIETDALMIGAGPVGVRTTIIAGGVGPFQPRRLRIAAANVLHGSAIHYKVKSLRRFMARNSWCSVAVTRRLTGRGRRLPLLRTCTQRRNPACNTPPQARGCTVALISRSPDGRQRGEQHVYL